MKNFSIAIHGGAGTLVKGMMTTELETQYKGALRHALDKGYAVLEHGRSAVDAVEEAVKLLEDPNHIPKRIIPLNEMSKVKSSTQQSWLKSGKDLLENSAAIIFGACLLGLVAYVAIGILNDA